jgi:molecular chaperone DnaK (HSP70)
VISVNIGSKKKFFTPEEISAMVLGKMREIAVSIFLPYYL